MVGKMRIAVPVESGEGFDAIRSAHFGHAPVFAVVDVPDGAPATMLMLPNEREGTHGCAATVHLLALNGVQHVSAAGMGRGALRELAANGIAVHQDTESETVYEAVAAILEGRTVRFTESQAHRGGHHHRH